MILKEFFADEKHQNSTLSLSHTNKEFIFWKFVKIPSTNGNNGQ